MRHPSWPLLSFFLLLAATSAQGQAPQPTATAQTISPGVTVTGRELHPLPKLPPDQFSSCMSEGGMDADGPDPTVFLQQSVICKQQLGWAKRVVLEACINRKGDTAPARVIQACTESLDTRLLQGPNNHYLLANRAQAYFATGDPKRALEDYAAAIKWAPRSAYLYYDRSIVLAAQSNDDAAVRDLDAAIGLDPKLVPALRQRARILTAEGNLSGALADYSRAIHLQPKDAAIWSERGYVGLQQHDYRSALQDETQAIQLDPKLARAYYLCGAALGDLGYRANAMDDIHMAVMLDPSLAHFVATRGETVSLELPPL